VRVTDPGELRAIAAEAARAAGTLLRERFEAGAEQALRTKSTPTDLVSQADLTAEAAIRDVLAAHRPDDAVLAEEGGEATGATGLRWVVDPLDGTINFLLGVPLWCVSVAVQDAAGTVAGVVFDPMAEELFAADRDGPATLDSVPLRGSAKAELAAAVVGTGFAYEAEVRRRQGELVARVLPRVANLRRTGSAALDLAWTAAGRLDAFYEHALNPWDSAAGAHICDRAGLVVQDLAAADGLPAGVLAAPTAFAGDLQALLGCRRRP
jgi:myo-inositol-1(or 4)-monophosphatase